MTESRDTLLSHDGNERQHFFPLQHASANDITNRNVHFTVEITNLQLNNGMIDIITSKRFYVDFIQKQS